METYIKKMTEIVKKDHEANHKYIHPNDISLWSCTTFNYDIHAIFHVGVNEMEMYLYEVIYFPDFDEYRVFCYKLNDQFDVDEGG